MPRKIFVLRHGQTLFNSQRKLQGHCDSALTDTGTTQAHKVGATLKGHLDGRRYKVYSSSLGRAVQTAHIVCEQIGHSSAQLIEDARLKEFALGLWEQRSIPELIEECPDLLDRRDWFLKAPEAESYESVKSRLLDWLADTPATEDLVVVSHGLTGIVLRGLLLDLSYDDLWMQDLPQDAFFIVSDGRIERIDC